MLELLRRTRLLLRARLLVWLQVKLVVIMLMVGNRRGVLLVRLWWLQEALMRMLERQLAMRR